MYFAHSHPERVKTITWLTPPDLNKALAGKLEPWERAKKGFSSSEQAAKHKNSITHEPLYRSDVVNRGHNNSHAKAIHKDGLFQYFEKELQSVPLLISKMRAIKQRALLEMIYTRRLNRTPTNFWKRPKGTLRNTLQLLGLRRDLMRL